MSEDNSMGQTGALFTTLIVDLKIEDAHFDPAVTPVENWHKQ